MTEPDSNPQPPIDASSSASSSARPSDNHPGSSFNIADEFGTAKRNLPPIKILAMATAGILILVALASFVQRAKPQGSGSLDNVAAVDLPGQNSVLVALTFTLRNSGQKTMFIHGIQGKAVTSTGESSGDAVSMVDFDRYYQAFPALKADAQPALPPEDKLPPGQEIKRTVMVSFPVPIDVFNQRKSVSVVIQPYDQPIPVTLTR